MLETCQLLSTFLQNTDEDFCKKSRKSFCGAIPMRVRFETSPECQGKPGPEQHYRRVGEVSTAIYEDLRAPVLNCRDTKIDSDIHIRRPDSYG